MVSYSYSDLHSVMNLDTDDDISAENTENLIDLAIDLLNLYSDASIDNMSGSAGSKTVTLTSAQRGAVQLVARTLYYSFYKDVTPTALGAITVTPVDALANPTIERLIRLAARKLVTNTFERT